MNIALRIAQAALFGMFSNAGFTKLRKSRKELIAMHWSWTQVYPARMIKFIGTMEILGALGVILPLLTRITPWLSPLAACGLALIMLLASLYHIGHQERMMLKITIPLFLLALFVIRGRRYLLSTLQ